MFHYHWFSSPLWHQCDRKIILNLGNCDSRFLLMKFRQDFFRSYMVFSVDQNWNQSPEKVHQRIFSLHRPMEMKRTTICQVNPVNFYQIYDGAKVNSSGRQDLNHALYFTKSLYGGLPPAILTFSCLCSFQRSIYEIMWEDQLNRLHIMSVC